MMFNKARAMPQTKVGEPGCGSTHTRVSASRFSAQSLAAILHCCLAIAVATPFGGCMFRSINNPKFDKTCFHASFSGIDHPAIELGDTAMYALEGSLWGGGVIGMGINAAYYTNFTTSSFYLRPELGMGDFAIGPIWLRWGLGYNIRFTHRAVAEMNQPCLSVRVTMPFDTVAIE